MKHACLLLVLMALLDAHAAAAQELVVIVNPASKVQRLRRDEVINIFMGRYRKFPSGVAAQPIDLARDSPRRQFYFLLVGKNLAEIDSYWARLQFSGQATAPQKLADEKAALERVASDPNAIAYVERTAVDRRVRIVHELSP